MKVLYRKAYYLVDALYPIYFKIRSYWDIINNNKTGVWVPVTLFYKKALRK